MPGLIITSRYLALLGNAAYKASNTNNENLGSRASTYIVFPSPDKSGCKHRSVGTRKEVGELDCINKPFQ